MRGSGAMCLGVRVCLIIVDFCCSAMFSKFEFTDAKCFPATPESERTPTIGLLLSTSFQNQYDQ